MRPLLAKWDELPEALRIPEVRPYWEALNSRYGQLAAKRFFDFAGSLGLLVVLAPAMGVAAVAIKVDSRGPVMYRQERVTQYGKHFLIHKFRTMVDGADRIGSLVTAGGDARITRVGEVLRKYRIDEFPQLIDILAGEMSFVGTRPEVPKYVNSYSPEMMATLLLPAGITSEASIRFKDEDALLAGVNDIDTAYVASVLPKKMRWNLESLREFSFLGELSTMLRTVSAALEHESAEMEASEVEHNV